MRKLWAAIAVMIAAAMLIAGCPSTPTNKKPTASVAADKVVLFVGGSVTFNASASKDTDGSVKTYTYDFGDGATSADVKDKASTHAYAKAGAFNATLVVKDDKGAKSAAANVVIAVVTKPMSSTATANTFDNITFSAENNTLVTEYAWNFGDNTPVVKGASVYHLFRNNGVYNVTLTVAYAGQSASEKVSVTVQNQPPSANITIGSAGPYYTNKAVAFNGALSGDVDGTVAKYAWNFGDNATENGSAASHKYIKPGSFTVTLTVTDDDNATAQVTMNIVVVKDLILKSTNATVYKDDNNISRANVTITFDNLGEAKSANTINITVTAFKSDKSAITQGDFKKSKTIGAPVDSATQGVFTTVVELLIDNGSPDQTWYFVEIAFDGNVVDTMWYQKS